MLSDLTTLQVNVLALVGWADGRFDECERTVLRDVLEASPGDDALKARLFRMADAPPDKESVFRILAEAPREMAAAAIKNAYVLAEADGYLHDGEIELLFEMGRAVGISRDRADDFRRMLETHLATLKLEQDLFGT